MDLSVYQRIVYIFFDIVYILALNIFCFATADKKRKLRTTVAASVLYMMADIFVYFTFTQMYIFSATQVVFSFLLLCLYSGQYIKNIVLSALWVACGSASEMLAAFIVAFFMKVSVSEAVGEDMTYLAVNCIARLVIFGMAIVYYSIFYRDKAIRKTPIYWLAVFIIYIGTMAAVIVLYSAYQPYLPNGESYKLFIVFIVLIMTDILIFYLYEQQAKSYAIRDELVQMKTNMDIQKSYYESESRARERESREHHDMKNFFIALEKYIQDGEYQKTIEKIQEKIGSIDRAKQKIRSGSDDIDMVLGHKISIAKHKGIKVDTNFAIMNSINLGTEDLMILLGNAMDNAIEAAEKSDNPYIFIEVESRVGLCGFRIENSVPEKVKIENNIIKTTKTESGHGWGLKSIGVIVEKYNGKLELACDDKHFTFRAVMVA